ncbi:MAG: phytoene desaturase family protein [Ginsengibacter sp.]
MKTAIVIGSGFSGLSSASYLAKSGWDVTVFEKHEIPGGRARKLEANGFIFDMGPSWYWMPDVFERYFENFGRKRSDYYSLTRLDPSYKVYWNDSEMSIPADYDDLKHLFETIEKDSSKKLDKYLKQAEYKYKVGIDKLVHKPGRSITEFVDWDLIKGLFKLEVFSSIRSHIQKNFQSSKLRQLLEFPVLFLGALPKDTPALYSLMNYADIVGGTWYPENGMYSVVESMYNLAEELGVKFRFKENVIAIDVSGKMTTGVTTQNGTYKSEVVIASADYHFVDSELLPQDKRNYDERYWDERVLAPSCLLYFIGLRKKIKAITHHSLFFDVDFDKHGDEIYVNKKWPEEPLFYVSATSVTDNTVAPEGCENLFFLIPVAAGLIGDDDNLREKYFEKIIARFERRIGENIRDHIIYKNCFGPSDFVKDYNAYKGNAYGLANTLMQTAILKPSCRSKKMNNLFYTGQLTVPGPGVPPSLISGEVVATEVIKHFGS